MTRSDIPPTGENPFYPYSETAAAVNLPKIAIGYGDEDFGSTDAEEVDTSLVTAGDHGEAIDRPEAIEHQDTKPGELIYVATSREEVLEKFRQWERDEPVESQAAVVGRLPELSDREYEILRSIDSYYHGIDTDDVMLDNSLKAQRETGLTGQQLRVVRSLYENFIEIVEQDAEAHDLGKIPNGHTLIEAGMYVPESNSTGWHVDLYRRPALRYVASLGDAGATDFGVGMMKRSDLPLYGSTLPDETVGPQGSYQLLNHGPGAISRFPANYGVHSSPSRGGFRLFMTASIELPPPWHRQEGL